MSAASVGEARTTKQAVWKYALPSRGRAEVEMPAGAEVLSAEAQHDQVTLWALVNPRAQAETRWFIVAMTGEESARGLNKKQFIGTVLLAGGAYVAHVFEAEDVTP